MTFAQPCRHELAGAEASGVSTLAQATASTLSTVKTPILSFEGSDLIVFETAQDAEAFVEPPDIQVGDTYDATGRVLRFETDGRLTRLIETDELKPDDLRAALLAVFAATEVVASHDAPFDELVAEASRHFGYSRRTVADSGRAMWQRLRRLTN